MIVNKQIFSVIENNSCIKMAQQQRTGLQRGFSSNPEMTEEQRLAKEFGVIDTNGDGRVDRHEMDTFLNRQGIDDEHR